MPLGMGGVGFEDKDANVPVIALSAKMLVKDTVRHGRVRIQVWLKEELAVDAKVGTGIDKDVKAAVAKLGFGDLLLPY
jgi:hypothetical protein